MRGLFCLPLFEIKEPVFKKLQRHLCSKSAPVMIVNCMHRYSSSNKRLIPNEAAHTSTNQAGPMWRV